jgi:putative FmdB family regulatory protein
MPTYTYRCEVCSCKFELFATFSNYIEQPVCEKCGSDKTHRAYVDDAKTSISFVKKSDSELKTIGDLANRNRDKLSNDQKAELFHKHNNYKEQVDKPLPKGMSRMKKTKTKNKWY